LERRRGDEKKGKGGPLKDCRTPISWALGMTLVFEIWSQFKEESVQRGRWLPLYQPAIMYMAYTGNGTRDSSPYYCTAGHRKLLYPPTTETIPMIPFTKLLQKFSLFYPIISSFRTILRDIPLALLYAATAEQYSNDI
jgi:hypothetical protein